MRTGSLYPKPTPRPAPGRHDAPDERYRVISIHALLKRFYRRIKHATPAILGFILAWATATILGFIPDPKELAHRIRNSHLLYGNHAERWYRVPAAEGTHSKKPTPEEVK